MTKKALDPDKREFSSKDFAQLEASDHVLAVVVREISALEEAWRLAGDAIAPREHARQLQDLLAWAKSVDPRDQEIDYTKASELLKRVEDEL